MYKRLSTKRLMHFAHMVFKIESHAFANGNHDLFKKCYTFNDEVYRELKKRGYK